MNSHFSLCSFLFLSLFFFACEEETPDDPDPGNVSLHAAFAEFDEEATDIYLDGSNVVIETTGLPNHTTPYWGEGHPLYVDPSVATAMTPTRIPDRADLSGTLTVSASPELASSSTSTSLGPIGIAVSGAYIYNDQEGGGALSSAIGSLDYTGGHIGPDLYHYHLEPKAFSDDDDQLVGILADGFFIYGRKCSSTGTYPTDLDASGGHVHKTEHSEGDEYHYHIENELYVTAYYIIFSGDYQGTPSRIN
ncbi:MAG: YHYH protein [Bacteroidota bacterium]